MILVVDCRLESGYSIELRRYGELEEELKYQLWVKSPDGAYSRHSTYSKPGDALYNHHQLVIEYYSE